MNNLVLIGIGAAALVAAYAVSIKQAENRGTIQERARVSVEAGKKNATAQAARKRVTADNADDVLSKYWRD